MSEPLQRSSKKAVIIALFLVFILGLFCAEIFLRFYFLGLKKQGFADYISRLTTANSFYIPFPYRIYAYKPSYLYKSTDGKRVHFINNQGFVGREVQKKKPEGVYRIICLGGSATANFENSDDNHTFPAQLERILSDKLRSKNIEVLNAGIRGYNTAEILIYLSLNLLDYQPDMIIFYEAFNDLLPNSYPNFSSDYSHFRRPAWYGLIHKRSLIEKIFEHSLIFVVIRSWITNYNEIHNVIAYSTKRPPQNPYMHLNLGGDSFKKEGFDTYERNIKSIIAIAQSRAIQVVIPTFAHVVEMDRRIHFPGDLRKLLIGGLAEHNNRVRQIWQTNNQVIGTDLDKTMSGKMGYFFDFVHFNDAGSLKAAELLAESIYGQLSTAISNKSIPPSNQPPAYSPGHQLYKYTSPEKAGGPH